MKFNTLEDLGNFLNSLVYVLDKDTKEIEVGKAIDFWGKKNILVFNNLRNAKQYETIIKLY